jgi:hypothetical protein
MRSVPARFVALAAIALIFSAAPQAGFGQVIPKPRPAITDGKVDSKPPKKAAKTEKTEKTEVAKVDHGSVYLLRGLANIFSLGMNTLGEELEKRGVDTVVTNHSYGFSIVDKLAKQYEADKSILPIILIGHSLGGNKTLAMAAKLAEKNIPVRLVVIFDATRAQPVPVNVQEVLNLVKPGSVGVKVAGAPGYAGVIENQEVSGPGIGHISIDKSKKLHAEVIEKVLAVLAEDPAKKKAPKKKPVIEQPVATLPDAKAPETTPPEEKKPEVTETKAPEATETKPPEATETKATETAKPPESTEAKAPEATDTKAPETTGTTASEPAKTEAAKTETPVVIPEAKPATTPAAPVATN